MLGKEIVWSGFIAGLLLAPVIAAQDDKPEAPPQVLTGIVVDAAGKTIAGAAIALVKANEHVDVKALLKAPEHTSNADGAFSVMRPKGNTRWQVLVAAKGRQACSAFAPYARTRPKVDLGQFVLPRGASLVGRFRDSDGNPIAGVQVSVAGAISAPSIASGLTRYVKSGAVSNARGIFQVPCVPRTGLELTARKQGFYPIRRLVSHESPLAFTLEHAQTIAGKLVDDDGAAIAEASISLKQEGAPTSLRESTRTAADGTFSMIAPPLPQRYRIAAYSSKLKRQFESQLLRGAQTAPDIKALVHTQAGATHLTLRVIDKETKKPIPKFAATLSSVNFDNLQTTLFQAEGSFQECEGEASMPIRYKVSGVIVVAPGHAVSVTEVPDELDKPLVVELGRGAVVHGRVVDDNDKPVADVAVRALPDGRASGSGGSIAKHWPRTDKDGKYRIDFLQPGKHQVQVYPRDRTASAPVDVEATLDQETELDLTIDTKEKLILNIKGELPPGPAPVISASGYSRGGRGFRHSVPQPQPIQLHRDQTRYEFGAVQGNRLSLLLFVPSRTRAGSGTSFPLNQLAVNDGKVDVVLPEFDCRVLRGRVEVDTRLPTERIAVVATAAEEERQRFAFSFRNRKVIAGLFADGSFEIDLPNREYVLQLVDLETGIVFHTETDNHKATADNLVIRPKLRWLEVKLAPDKKNGPIVVQSFQVELERPRAGEQDAFLQGRPGRGTERRNISLRSHPMRLRWLVPPGQLKVAVQHAPEALQKGGNSYRYSVAAEKALEITKTEQTLTLKLPAPPTDEELEQPQK